MSKKIKVKGCKICKILGKDYEIDSWDGPRRTGSCGLPSKFPKVADKLIRIRFGQNEAVRKCPVCGTFYEHNIPYWDNEVGDTHHHIQLKRLSNRAAKIIINKAKKLFEKRNRKRIRRYKKRMEKLTEEETSILEYQVRVMGSGLYLNPLKREFSLNKKELNKIIESLEKKGIIYKAGEEEKYQPDFCVNEKWKKVFSR